MEQTRIQLTENQIEGLTNKKGITLLLGSLVLGLLFNFLFYRKSLGLSYPLYITALYTFLFWSIKKKPKLKLDFIGLLGISIIALSFTYFFFSSPFFHVLNFLLIPILVVAHTLLLTSNSRFKWFEASFFLDMLNGIFIRPLENCLKPFSLIISNTKRITILEKSTVMLKVLMGLILTIPLLIIIVPLLASADDVFHHFIDQIPNLFQAINLSYFIPQFLIVTVVTCLVFSYIWSLFYSKPKFGKGISNLEILSPGKFLDPITVTTLLIVIDALYVFFIAIQFSYLFGSLTDSLPHDFTFAQYARKGFFELVDVTLINLVLLIGNMYFVKASGKKLDSVVRILNTILVMSTFIMLLSAHFRMSLYEDAYGFTYLRVLTHAFMGYLFVLFVVSFIKIWRQSIPLFKSFVVISIVAYTLLNYISVDKIIVKENITRYTEGKPIDVYYLTTLSYDAIPPLVEFMDQTHDLSLITSFNNGLNNKKTMLNQETPWQSFNLSKYRAQESLKESFK
ncbi:DUF4153 domain-containing protein [Desulfitobacterium metallireducens]|uniref:Membrane protein n=1 Tax=Desulfitobacterium metallireducens DSM 15288 TaxID=871968 RepID=W0ECJ4_9FIRM|nr:DUF4173 domain-containing protein [Desulfitobacterium metallireducens]AHF07223.1 membrane protein [Desulfitobacterium metallireducens DSM 15288]